MKAKITLCYKKGRKIPPDSPAPTFSGDLNVAEGRTPLSGRIAKEASLIGDNGGNIVPPMIDVQLVGIFGLGLTLRGTETIGNQEYAQEWWVQFE
jgi:hypothetical protein